MPFGIALSSACARRNRDQKEVASENPFALHGVKENCISCDSDALSETSSEKECMGKDSERSPDRSPSGTTTCSLGLDPADAPVSPTDQRLRAHDLSGNGHRAREWTGTTALYVRGEGPVEAIRRVQKTWCDEHPEQLLKWSFPTKRRDCIRVSFRAIEKMEACASTEFRAAFVELVGRCPLIVTRSLGYLYLNYLQPHHKQLVAKGRHLLMLKVYEGKAETNVWFIPVHEVRTLHLQQAEVMKGGVSLNDVQLVETYAIESTLAVHCETFARDSDGKGGLQRGNQYGECTWIGGMAIHMIFEKTNERIMEKSFEFSAVPDAELARLCEKGAKVREKRARKKQSQKAKKAESAAVQAEEEKIVRDQIESAASLQRKAGLLKPHASLNALFQSGPMQVPTDEDTTTSEDDDD